jgi:hypothetical protein
MGVNNFGLGTLTRYPGFGYGWFNIFGGSSARVESASITRLLSLNKGDRIKGVAKVVIGSPGFVAPHTVRFRVRKIPPTS